MLQFASETPPSSPPRPPARSARTPAVQSDTRASLELAALQWRPVMIACTTVAAKKSINRWPHNYRLCKYEPVLLLLLLFICLARATVVAKHERRPDSSSSILADIEDLNDSSVRTRLGTVTIEHLGTAPGDFDELIEKIAPHETASGSGGQSITNVNNYNKVPADANNKTTMRFFRNSKTFASIVYTNPIQGGRKQARRLINCHLVDLEKHASDVAIYEAKYDIHTIDIEFKEMMQLLEACTNIARLRRRPLNGIGQQPGAPGSQYKTSGSQQSASSTQTFDGGLLAGPAQGALRPMVVVGRPLVAKQQHQQQAAFQQVMSHALNKELAKMGPQLDDSPLLDLPHSAPAFTEMHNHNSGFNININIGRSAAPTTTTTRRPAHQHYKQKRHQQRGRFEPYPLPELYAKLASGRQQRSQLSGNLQRHPLVGALAKVSEQSKRLVLGEITAPPSLSLSSSSASGNSNSSSLREALQEISSYDTSDLLSIWRGILPGTNWCGMGDRATSYNDLGFESDIDICCRAHDFCPVRLSAFTSGYGLFNWSFYTRSHCWCDQNFLDCLQQAESPLSAVVMKFYFSIMKTTCLNDIETSDALDPQARKSSAANNWQQQKPMSPQFVSQAPPKIAALQHSRWLQTVQSEPVRKRQ